MPHLTAGIEVNIDGTDVAIVVAVLLLVISLGSLVFTWRADRRADAIELRTRQAELALTAGATSGPHGRDAGCPDGGVWIYELYVDVRNVGMGTAREIRVWLVNAV